MIIKRFRKIGRISKPYYTQNNEQPIDDEKLGKIRQSIESKIGGDQPYDIYNMIADQAKRIDVLETLIKNIDKDCILNPKLDMSSISNVYTEVNNRMIAINGILEEI